MSAHGGNGFKGFAQVCDSLKLEYQIVSDAMVDIYGKVRITEFVLALAKGGVRVESFC